MQLGMLADAANVVPNASGMPTGRSGSVKYNSTSLGDRITSFHEFRSGISTRDKLCSYSSKVAKYNTLSGDFDDIITGLTSGKMLQWTNFQDKAICVNEGNDAPQYYTTTALCGDLAGSPPVGRTICNWANRVWFGGDSTNVGTLTGCALNDPTDYATAGASGFVSQVVGDNNDTITGMAGFFDWLLVGKRNNIYKVYGVDGNPSDTTQLAISPLYSRTGTDNTGFTSPWAITQVGNDILFLDGYDIKSLNATEMYGDIEYVSIIPHFSDYLRSIVDADYLQYTQFFHYKKEQQIWVSIPTSATTHFVFVLDYRFKRETQRYAFFPMSGLPVNVFGGIENGEVNDVYYGDETGYIFQLDTGNNDEGSSIERWVTYPVIGKSHVHRKQFLSGDMLIEPSGAALTMTPYYAVDLRNGEQARTAGNFTALDAETVSGWDGTGVKRKRIPLPGITGSTLLLKWHHNRISENFTINPSEVNVKYKKKNVFS